MTPRFLLAFVVFILALSATAVEPYNINAAINTKGANNTAFGMTKADVNAGVTNNTTGLDSTKARFLCTFYNEVIRVILIDKNIETLPALQAQIASFFHEMPVKFDIQYQLRNQDRHDNMISVITDDNVRSLMALYEALTSFYPDPMPIALKVTPPDRSWLFLMFMAAVVLPFIACTFLLYYIENTFC